MTSKEMRQACTSGLKTWTLCISVCANVYTNTRTHEWVTPFECGPSTKNLPTYHEWMNAISTLPTHSLPLTLNSPGHFLHEHREGGGGSFVGPANIANYQVVHTWQCWHALGHNKTRSHPFPRISTISSNIKCQKWVTGKTWYATRVLPNSTQT